MLYIPKALIPEVKAMIAKYKEEDKLSQDQSVRKPSQFYRSKKNRLLSKMYSLDD